MQSIPEFPTNNLALNFCLDGCLMVSQNCYLSPFYCYLLVISVYNTICSLIIFYYLQSWTNLLTVVGYVTSTVFWTHRIYQNWDVASHHNPHSAELSTPMTFCEHRQISLATKDFGTYWDSYKYLCNTKAYNAIIVLLITLLTLEAIFLTMLVLGRVPNAAPGKL